MKQILQSLNFLSMISISCLFLASCIHPQVGLRKSRLVDPMMDPAIAAPFGDTMGASIQGQFEKAVVGSGSVGGGSCPTCK